MSESPDAGAEAAPPRPLLRIVRGEPSEEELAALIAVIAARAAAGAVPAPALASGWQRSPGRGPAAWRLSGFLKGVHTRASW